MHVAQSGIFALGTGSHSYLEFEMRSANFLQAYSRATQPLS